jgi:hypothetical protein
VLSSASSQIANRAKQALRVAASRIHARKRVYPRPIALCNEIRIRSPASSCFTRCVSHALFLLTVHVDVTTIPQRVAYRCKTLHSPGNRLCECDYIIVKDKRGFAREVKIFPRLIASRDSIFTGDR